MKTEHNYIAKIEILKEYFSEIFCQDFIIDFDKKFSENHEIKTGRLITLKYELLDFLYAVQSVERLEKTLKECLTKEKKPNEEHNRQIELEL